MCLACSLPHVSAAVLAHLKLAWRYTADVAPLALMGPSCRRLLKLWSRCLFVLSLVERREFLLLELARVLERVWDCRPYDGRSCDVTSARVALLMIRDIFLYPPSWNRLLLVADWLLSWMSTLLQQCCVPATCRALGSGRQWDRYARWHARLQDDCLGVVRRRGCVYAKLVRLFQLLDQCEFPFVPIHLEDVKDLQLRCAAVHLVLRHKGIRPRVVPLAIAWQIVSARG